ncbi:MAG: hypothetical protein WKG01_12025 [Kofleriaceae bacterium]
MRDLATRARIASVVLACLVVAGCDDSVAIEIREPADSEATWVELFIGVDRCKEDGHACEGIGAKGRNGSREPGTVYYRDDNRPFRSKVSGGVAEFLIAAEDRELPTIIAIGVSEDPASELVLGATQLSGVNLGAGAARYVGTLERIDDNTANDALLWRRPSDDVGCAGFRASNAQLTTFVVAEGDPDCDEVADELECDPLVWKAETASPGATCITHGRAGGDQVCVFGAPTCIDGEGTSGCTPGPACLPERLCQCEGAADEPACLLAALALPNLTHLRCPFPLYQDTMDADWTPCPGVQLEAQLDSALLQRACAQPDFLLDAATGMYGETIQIDSDPTHKLTVKLAPLADTTKCRLLFSVVGSAASALPPPQRRSVLRLPVIGNGRAILLPIDLVAEHVGDLAACPGDITQPCTLEFGPIGTTETIEACGN